MNVCEVCREIAQAHGAGVEKGERFEESWGTGTLFFYTLLQNSLLFITTVPGRSNTALRQSFEY